MAEIMKLELTQEWDKTFPKSGKVNHRKVTFHNRYGLTLADAGNIGTCETSSQS